MKSKSKENVATAEVYTLEEIVELVLDMEDEVKHRRAVAAKKASNQGKLIRCL